MRFTSPAKESSSPSGFTLVEILIIAPLVILTITAFVVLIITLTGDVIRTKGSSDAAYNTQEALNQIEDDARLTTEFRTTSYTTQSPQGIVGTNYDTGGATISSVAANTPVRLIMRTLATTTNPNLDTKSLVYRSTDSSCATVSTIPYAVDTVYYVKINSSDGSQSLWRRIVFGAPTGTDAAGYSCPTSPATVWQRASCTPPFPINTVCKTDDSELLKNVTSVTAVYYDSNGTDITSSANSGEAVTVKVTIQTSDSVAGRSNTYTGTLYTKRGNSPLAPIIAETN